jgi:hypothetical protein
VGGGAALSTTRAARGRGAGAETRAGARTTGASVVPASGEAIGPSQLISASATSSARQSDRGREREDTIFLANKSDHGGPSRKWHDGADVAEEDPLDKLDYYDLLRIDEGANADDVRRAFHEFAVRYHPDRYAGAEEEKRERAASIYRRGAEAYRVLTDVELRRRYDDGLKKGLLRYEEPKSTTARPSSGVLEIKNLRARPFFQKALEQIKAGDYKGAKLNLSLAINHEPDNELLKSKLDEVKLKLAGP